jgi:hypothetical protein
MTSPLFFWSIGFAMLDRLRAALLHAESLLMGRHILLLHRDFWVAEQEQFVSPCTG